MQKTKKQNAKRSRKGLIAVALACALLVATGSWAWQSFQSLTASNVLKTATYNVELHDLFNGVDQVSNSKDLKNGGTAPAAVTLEDWQAGVNTPKQIWLKNPADSSGPIFVRLQLTEIITGGDAPYNVTGDVFDGTTAAAVAQPSLISWTLGAPIVRIGDWDGVSAGPFWLMDESTGYAYWMEMLEPGETTDEFLSSIKLLAEQENELTYNINVKADAISATVAGDRAQWNTPASTNDTGLDALFSSYREWKADPVEYAAAKLQYKLPGLIADPASPVEAGAKVEVINGLPVITDANGDVYLIEENFPDDSVREKIAELLGKNDGDKITQAEIDSITEFRITDSSKDITTLAGVAAFPNLESIVVAYQPHLESVDFSKNSKLKTINLSGSTNVETINITGLTDLETVILTQTKIYSIDLSKQNNLKAFHTALQNQSCDVIWPANPMNKLEIYVSNFDTLNGLNTNNIRMFIFSATKSVGQIQLFPATADTAYTFNLDNNKIMTYTLSHVNSGFTVNSWRSDGSNNVNGTSLISPVLQPQFLNNAVVPQNIYMVQNGVTVTKGGTINGANINVSANGIVMTGNGYYTLTNGGTVSNTGVITSNGAGTWTPVHVTSAGQAIAAASGAPVSIGAGALTNHQ